MRARLGKQPGPVVGGDEIAPVLFVSDEVDSEWERLAPYLMHEANMYGAWAAEAGTNEHLFRPVDDIEGVRVLGMYSVVTPDECIERARGGAELSFHPMAGGIPPQLRVGERAHIRRAGTSRTDYHARVISPIRRVLDELPCDPVGDRERRASTRSVRSWAARVSSSSVCASTTPTRSASMPARSP